MHLKASSRVALAALGIAVGLAAAGCGTAQWPVSPERNPFVEVYGVVTYPSGGVADDAMVWSRDDAGTPGTHTDAQGRYSLILVSPRDSFVVMARNGYSSRVYGEYMSGTCGVRVTAHRVRADIVLDHSEPI